MYIAWEILHIFIAKVGYLHRVNVERIIQNMFSFHISERISWMQFSITSDVNWLSNLTLLCNLMSSPAICIAWDILHIFIAKVGYLHRVNKVKERWKANVEISLDNRFPAIQFGQTRVYKKSNIAFNWFFDEGKSEKCSNRYHLQNNLITLLNLTGKFWTKQ